MQSLLIIALCSTELGCAALLLASSLDAVNLQLQMNESLESVRSK
jgi:hypothetical protein